MKAKVTGFEPMKKIILLLMLSITAGCVDTGRVGLHPHLQTAYFNAHPYQVQSCLFSAAINQHLSLERDDPLPGGAQRYNLEQGDGTVIAWIETDKFNHSETSVNFVYDAQAADIRAAVATMIAECKSAD